MLRPGIVLRIIDARPAQRIVADVVIEYVVTMLPSHTGICFASFQWRKMLIL